MSTRFDKRLKEAGLFGKSPSHSHSVSPSSSMEDDLVNSDDPGYALLMVTPTGPVMDRGGGVENLYTTETEGDDGGYAIPADALKISPHTHNLQKSLPTSPVVPEREFAKEDEGGYTSPVDALRVSPRILSLQRTPSSPSPPTSPLVSDPSSQAVYDSPYESVAVIRKMREQQIKEKAGDEKRVTPAAASATTEEVESQDDDKSGYSRPFDALKKTKKIRCPSDASNRKPPTSLPPWQRSSSNGRTEFSARAHHQIGSPSPSSSKSSLEHILDEFPKRSTSSSTNKPAPKPMPRGNRTDPPTPPPPVNSKPRNQTPSVSTTVTSRSGSSVNRYVLKVGNGVSGEEKENQLSRGESGRTRSVNSALNGPPPPPRHTPAKVTKLRDGRAKISVKARGTTTSPPSVADINTKK